MLYHIGPATQQGTENASLQAIWINLYKTYLPSADNTRTTKGALFNPTSVGIGTSPKLFKPQKNFDNTLTLKKKKVINSACMHDCARWL